VKAVKAPPLKLPDTLEEGMLSLAPSVSAAGGLVKYAYSEILPKMSGSLQLVVMLTGALPAAVPFRTRVKFTSPGAAVMVMPLFSVALRFTVATLDLICAPAGEGQIAKRIPSNTNAGIRKRSEKLTAPSADLSACLNMVTTILFQNIAAKTASPISADSEQGMKSGSEATPHPNRDPYEGMTGRAGRRPWITTPGPERSARRYTSLREELIQRC
jgi:hypothetical protein